MKRHFRQSLVTVFVSIIFASIPRVVFAQDALSRAKGFYESADYEEALQLLDTLRGKTTNTEAAAYRVFCLVALGRNDEAKVAVEAIVRVDPLFRPADSQVSPRLRTFFEDIRKPLLPEIARQSYSSAKTAFDRKDWAPALTDFERVLALLSEIGGAEQGAADLRTLASGFRDLARTALEPPKPVEAPHPAAPPPATKPVAPPEPSIYGMQHMDVKRPVAVSKTMPEWRPENPVEERMTFEGAVEVVIGEDGKVLSSRILESVHPRYDPLLLKAAAAWMFKPATKNGVAVKFRYTIAVKLGT